MKNLSLPIIFDTFFIFFISLFFFYALFLYGVGGFSLSIFLSTLIAVIISFGFIVFSLKKGETKKNKENEKINIKNFNYNLYFLSKSKLLEILKDYYLIENNDVKLTKNYLEIDGKSIIIPIIKPEQVTINDIVFAVKQGQHHLKRIILGVNFSEDCIVFINDVGLDIELLKTEELYLMLKEKNITINSIEINPKPKNRIIHNLNKVFTKKQYKRFLLAGVVITASSFFSFYPLYYLIFGGVLLFLGAYLKLFKKGQKA